MSRGIPSLIVEFRAVTFSKCRVKIFRTYQKKTVDVRFGNKHDMFKQTSYLELFQNLIRIR